MMMTIQTMRMIKNLNNGQQQCELLVDGRGDFDQAFTFGHNPAHDWLINIFATLITLINICPHDL